jgi:hypothetical protein
MFDGSRLGVLLPMLTSAVACGGLATMEVGKPSDAGPADGPVGPDSASRKEPPRLTTEADASAPAVIDLCEFSGVSDLPYYHRLPGLTTTPAVDYLEYRHRWANAAPTVLESVGIRCATATNKAKCEDDVAGYATDAGWNIGQDTKQYLLGTRGDAVVPIVTLDELRAFIVPVDNGKDAALLATATGEYRIYCGWEHAKLKEHGVSIATQTATGWRVGTIAWDCSKTLRPPAEVYMVDVTREGTTTVTHTAQIDVETVLCGFLPGRRPAGLIPDLDAT